MNFLFGEAAAPCIWTGGCCFLPGEAKKNYPGAVRFLTAREQVHALRSASRKLSTQDFKSWYEEARTADDSIISVAGGSSQWPAEGQRWVSPVTRQAGWTLRCVSWLSSGCSVPSFLPIFLACFSCFPKILWFFDVPHILPISRFSS